MGSPIPGSMGMPDMPEHWAITVDHLDRVVAPDSPAAVWTECGCQDPDCLKYYEGE